MRRVGKQTWVSESQFVDSVVNRLSELFSSEKNESKVIRELSVGRTVADVVIAIPRKKNCSHFPQVLSVREAVVLASLRQTGPTRIDLLEKRCGFPNKGLRGGQLNKFSKQGLIKNGKGGQISLMSLWADSVKLIAIEAKLEKWRQALRQAMDYRKYADEVYVLLPEQNAKLAVESVNEFRESGIGLLVASKSSVEAKVRPRPSLKHDWRREFACSRIRNLH